MAPPSMFSIKAAMSSLRLSATSWALLRTTSSARRESVLQNFDDLSSEVKVWHSMHLLPQHHTDKRQECRSTQDTQQQGEIGKMFASLVIARMMSG